MSAEIHGKKIRPICKRKVMEQISILDISRMYSPKIREKTKRPLIICPFHDDNHASMSVIDRDNMKIFNCFSCGEKGNVISFYAKYYGISYGQATIKLALKLGIPVDNYLLSDNHQNERLYKRI